MVLTQETGCLGLCNICTMLVLQASIRHAHSASDDNFLAVPNMGGGAEETAISVDNKPQSGYNTPYYSHRQRLAKIEEKKWENIEIQQ